MKEKVDMYTDNIARVHAIYERVCERVCHIFAAFDMVHGS